MAKKTRSESGGRTADSLRAAIDSGRTGDKVGFSDPAAAPLGSDDEAAGRPPSPEEVALAKRHETGRPPDDDRPAQADARGSIWSAPILVATIVAVAVLIALGAIWLT